MPENISPNIEAILQCPQCGLKLTKDKGSRFLCTECPIAYELNDFGSYDLRLQSPKSIDLSFTISTENDLLRIHCNENLPKNQNQQVDYNNILIPEHLNEELLSYFPKASSNDSMMLDLGCGDTVHKKVCEHAGFTYVGVDFENPKAPYWADAHSLPFQDNSFEFLLSVAVLEHIQFPFVAIREANRVLRSGGLFIGTIAFLEPFHGNSYYHHSLLGTLNTLLYGGFEIVQIAASTSYTVFDAQAGMSYGKLFPRIPKSISRNFILLPKKLSELYWKIGKLFERSTIQNRQIDHMAGAFYFILRKPD